MVKHTQIIRQIIRRLLATNCLSAFDHFVRLVPKELKTYFTPHQIIIWLILFKHLKEF